jgi:hypothetical protein
MDMDINLGSITIPINAATKIFALLAKWGAGKSYTGAVSRRRLYVLAYKDGAGEF